MKSILKSGMIVELRNMVFGLYDGYLNDYMQVYAEENGIKDLDEVDEKDIYSMIYDDLSDKGFMEEEIEEIISRKMKKKTLYKLGAYMIALYGAEDYDEWVDIIKDDIEVKLSGREMRKLWKAYGKIDY